MWSTVGGIIQVLTIVVTATFGILGTLSKREPGSRLKQSEKIALASIIVASLLALTAFAVDRIKKQQDRDNELRRVAEEVERQGKLLLEVQRGQHAIQEFGVEVTYTMPATHPQLTSMIDRWNDYIARAKPSDFESGYSKDGSAFASWNKQGKISRLAIHDRSDLYPKQRSIERNVLFPALVLKFFRQGAVIDLQADDTVSPFERTGKDLDLSLFIPFQLANHIPKPQDGSAQRKTDMTVRLWYDVEKAVIEVSGRAAAVTALADTGALVSLLDLPGRQIVLTGLRAADVSDIKSIKLTATTRTGRFWSGHKEIFGKMLVKSDVGKFKIASYTLKASDFRGLEAWASMAAANSTNTNARPSGR